MPKSVMVQYAQAVDKNTTDGDVFGLVRAIEKGLSSDIKITNLAELYVFLKKHRNSLNIKDKELGK